MAGSAALTSTTTGAERRPLHRTLYAWVLVGILLGVAVGAADPALGASLEPVGGSFVDLIKMVITPVIFCTVVVGIGSVDSLKRVGRIGVKALVYFEVVTTAALALGLVVMNVLRPGDGVHATSGALKVNDTVSGFISPSPRATSCRCWSSPCCSASPSTSWANPASRWSAASSVSDRRSSASCAW
jgi:Na+/H+-dicarboxylate symporter